jgi:hypothetical protein
LNCDWLYDRPPIIDRISPVRGSIATSAAWATRGGPRLRRASTVSILDRPATSASCAYRCKLRSSVV